MKSLSLLFSCFLLLGGLAHGHLVILDAVLSGPAESPANASPATGTAVVTMDLDLITLDVQFNFSGLTGTTTAAHIHGPTATAGSGTAGVMTITPSFTGFPTGLTSGSYSQTYDLTDSASYNPAFLSANGPLLSDALNAFIFAMEDGKAYLNIHTTAFPGGEIRGFLIARPEVVPEPGSVVLIGLCGTALAMRRRRGRSTANGRE